MILRRVIILAHQQLANVLFVIVAVFSELLRKCSGEKWLYFVQTIVSGGTRSMDLPEIAAYKAKQRQRLKSGAESGVPDGYAQQFLASDYPAAAIDLPAWAKEVRPFLANQLSEHTRKAYENDLKQFVTFLEGRLQPHRIADLKAEHVILYRKELEEGRITGAPLAKSSINRKLAVVKSFLNWLQLNRIVAENPASLVKGYPQNQESSLKGLSDEEVRKMLLVTNANKPSGALHCAVLHVLLYLGLRKSELIGLKIGDWDTERGVEVVRVRGKGHKVRVLPITERVRAALNTYCWVCGRSRDRKNEPMFIPTKNPRRPLLLKTLNPNAITYIVARYAKKAGVLKIISPHSCRATCISHALDKKASHRSVQHLAGWSTPLMIQRYDKRREELQNSAAYTIDYGETTAVSA
jgi:site-specific recombinase XerD